MSLSRFLAAVALSTCIGGGVSAVQGVQVPWTPPKTSLPASFVAAVAKAFDNGLPDPRGGEFRDVTITVSDPWSTTAREIQVTGWVLPATTKADACVICWNGLPYKPTSVGAKRDLTEVVEHPPLRLHSSGDILGEPYDVDSQRTTLGAALLLRVGRADLADKFAMRTVAYEDQIVRYFGDQVLWFRFDRATAAHARGDDNLALDDSQWLVGHASAFDEMQRLTAHDYAPRFFDAKTLSVDSQRRLARGPRKGLDPVAVKALSFAERVREIVDRLDEAHYVVHTLPATFSWKGDPVYEAALEVGEPMVPALLECAENDGRLTRGVDCPSMWQAPRVVTPVRELALDLATQIMGLERLRGVDAPRVKALWAKWKSLSIAERRFEVLENDELGPQQWLNAAQRLTDAVDVKRGLEGAVWPPNQGKPGSPMRGESLRSKTNPSLSELMATRAAQMMPRAWSSERDLVAAEDAVKLAQCLAKWDAKGSQQVFKALYIRLAGVGAAFKPGTEQRWRVAADDLLGTLSDLRIRAGDTGAEADYESWICAAGPPDSGISSVRRLFPLIEDPAWGERAAKRLFLGADALWSPARFVRGDKSWWVPTLMDSKLLSLGTVRESLVAALKDRTTMGKVWREKLNGSSFIVMQRDDYNSRWPDVGKPDRRDPGDGVRVPYRVCDVVALALTDFHGAPLYRPYWSIRDRNVTLGEMIAFVRKSGAGLVDLRPAWAFDLED